jgi:hypothetical protein
MWHGGGGGETQSTSDIDVVDFRAKAAAAGMPLRPAG